MSTMNCSRYIQHDELLSPIKGTWVNAKYPRYSQVTHTGTLTLLGAMPKPVDHLPPKVKPSSRERIHMYTIYLPLLFLPKKHLDPVRLMWAGLVSRLTVWFLARGFLFDILTSRAGIRRPDKAQQKWKQRMSIWTGNKNEARCEARTRDLEIPKDIL